MGLGKTFVGAVEPLTFLHLLKRVCKGVRVVLDHRLHLPQLRAFDIGLVPQKNINLGLSGLVFEVVVEVTLDRSEKLKPRFGSLLNFLFMGQTTAILDRN